MTQDVPTKCCKKKLFCHKYIRSFQYKLQEQTCCQEINEISKLRNQCLEYNQPEKGKRKYIIFVSNISFLSLLKFWLVAQMKNFFLTRNNRNAINVESAKITKSLVVNGQQGQRRLATAKNLFCMQCFLYKTLHSLIVSIGSNCFTRFKKIKQIANFQSLINISLQKPKTLW